MADYYALMAEEDPRAQAAALNEAFRQQMLMGRALQVGSRSAREEGAGLLTAANADRNALMQAGGQNFNARRLREAAAAETAARRDAATDARTFEQEQQGRLFQQQRDMANTELEGNKALERLRASLKPRGGGGLNPLQQAELALKQEELKFRQANGGRTPAQVEKDEKEARLSDKQTTAIGDLDGAIGLVDNIIAQKPNYDTGPISNLVNSAREMVGMGDPEQAAFRMSVIRQLNAELNRLSGGAITAAEMPRLVAGMPSLKDDDKAFEAKAQELRRELGSKRQGMLSNLERQGKDVAEYREGPSVRVMGQGEAIPGAGKTVVKYQVNKRTGQRRAVYADGTFGSVE